MDLMFPFLTSVKYKAAAAVCTEISWMTESTCWFVFPQYHSLPLRGTNTYKNKYILCFWSRTRVWPWGIGGRRSDHVALIEQKLVTLRRVLLLRPVRNNWLAESTTAQLKERHQVLHHTHAVRGRREENTGRLWTRIQTTDRKLSLQLH